MYTYVIVACPVRIRYIAAILVHRVHWEYQPPRPGKKIRSPCGTDNIKFPLQIGSALIHLEKYYINGNQVGSGPGWWGYPAVNISHAVETRLCVTFLWHNMKW